MIFDPLYLLALLPGLALSLWASWRVKSTFRRYSRIPSHSRMSGAEAARELLRLQGIDDVSVQRTKGFLSDHYDPGAKVLRLSPDVYDGRSLASLGVAAHETGHAIQHATHYRPLGFRSLVVKPAMFGSNLGIYLVFGGLILNLAGMIWLGIILFSVFVVFTLVTLPVEFNASSRAVEVLVQSGIVTHDEAPHTREVLNAAAMTYVAATIAAVLQLFYLLWRAGILGGNRH